MRILFLSSVYPRSYAPVRGIYCHSLCRALAARHEVRVISPITWLERLRHRRLFSQGRVGPSADGADEPVAEYPWYLYPPKVLRSRHGWFMWRSIRSPVARALAEFAPDCVLSYWLHPDGDTAVRAARSAGVPSAVIVGGSDALLLPREPARRKSIGAVLESADALITVSRGLKDKVVALGADAGKVHVIYQGIDRALFHPGDRTEARHRLGLPVQQKALLWIGGMVPVKAVDTLLDACHLLRAQNADFRLYLIGDGPLRAALAARVETLGMADSVTFLGALPPARLPDWYRAADLTVLSSLSEGIPNVLRESLACGTPFVATRVGDIAELCPEAAGDLVPPGDPTALAAAIVSALGGRGAKPPRSHPSSWGEYADEVADLLQQLAPAPARSGSLRSQPVTSGERV
jgi:glycosyltransferase involved in cell wall biosynthesis